MVRTDRERINELSWEEFKTEMKSEFLPKDWEDKFRLVVYDMRHKKTEEFREFINRFKSANMVLRGTRFFLEGQNLTNQMEVAACDDLQRMIMATKELAEIWTSPLTDIKKVKEWENAVIVLDENRLAERDRFTAFLAANQTQPTTNRQIPSNSRGGRSDQTTPNLNNRLPKLTDAEKTILGKHDGCFKCRRFYANHKATDCTNPWPDAKTYMTITEADGLAAQAKRNKSGANAVASITGIPETTIAAVRSYSPLAATTGILGNGSDSDGPTWPKVYNMLIDCGAPSVLICDDLVLQLELRRRRVRWHVPPLGDAYGRAAGEENQPKEWTNTATNQINAEGKETPERRGIKDRSRRIGKTEEGIGEATWRRFKGYLRNRKITQRILSMERERRAGEEKRLKLGKVIQGMVGTGTELEKERDGVEGGEDGVGNEGNFKEGVGYQGYCAVTAVRQKIEQLAFIEQLKQEDATMKKKYADRFPDDIPHIDDLPSDVLHRIKLTDANLTISRRQYDCPKKYREAWKVLLNQHLAAGRIRPSASPYASPSFLIPKADPMALPRWVNDYWILNKNTVPDRHPLPKISDILADCAKGKIWGKLDMTNSFFQTRVHPDDIPYTAVTTPFGLYEWLVMPQGGRNAPATHQRRMFQALRPLIGSICHVYLDDIIIWSESLEQHRINVSKVLEALREHHLFASLKKTTLFATEIDFLGHHISQKGIEADPKKVEKIVNWPTPRSSTDVRAFLGLVRYVADFLPRLADHTAVLTPLTTKEADKVFPTWSSAHQIAFDAIKQLVLSRDCLTTIDHDNPGDNRIFVACDASDRRTGAVLTWGPTKESARPVAFDFMQLKGAELNYPVHEKELLAIIRALKKWRVDLLGEHFTIYTDHRTLENFQTQKELSQRQARWQELMGQYDFEIVYVPGELNTAADALSRLPDDIDIIAAIAHAPTGALRIAADPEWIRRVKRGYQSDPWCRGLDSAAGFKGMRRENDLWYVGNRLVIPRVPDLREGLFRLAHDARGHFGFDKSYEVLRNEFYWPNMRKEIESMYIPSCEQCQGS
ncbi:hypothetical protein NLI96_g12135 [Meripilus lineatus]|uniref:Reverse transcriptase n=1 Tax=Meripilus lineatus TaxID=2056292 RepID=A0AAD5UQM7_9APHY|nr:hypothetical protein NLI96_g12135 [Physisporinus lineatus]